MNRVASYRTQHLHQLAELVNAHLSSAMPGWALPPALLAARLERNPEEYVIDPWVRERRTLVALERERVVAAAHLHRYGGEEPVGPDYRGAAVLVWFLAWPAHTEAGRELLAAVREVLDGWAAHRHRGPAGLGALYVPGLGGVPDSWPHVAALLREGGFRPDPEMTERLYGGRLDAVPPPAPAPLADASVERSVANLATRFTARAGERVAGVFDVACDCTHGGEIPALAGWADAWSLHVEPELRGRGIGRWLVAQAVAWLRLAGCDRMVLSVTLEDEAAGAGRFYERLGWQPLATVERGWARGA